MSWGDSGHDLVESGVGESGIIHPCGFWRRSKNMAAFDSGRFGLFKPGPDGLVEGNHRGHRRVERETPPCHGFRQDAHEVCTSNPLPGKQPSFGGVEGMAVGGGEFCVPLDDHAPSLAQLLIHGIDLKGDASISVDGVHLGAVTGPKQERLTINLVIVQHSVAVRITAFGATAFALME